MPTRSPLRVEQLSFLLRQKPTVRSAGILERRCSFFLYCPFGLQKEEDGTIKFFFLFFSSLKIHLIPSMSSSLGFLTLGTFSTINFHHLSTIATCVTIVHVIGVTPQTRGSVDYPSTRGIQVDVGLPYATLENWAVSFVRGALPKYNTCMKPIPNSPI